MFFLVAAGGPLLYWETRFSMKYGFAILAILGCTLPGLAQDAGVLRVITFRDGSMLRLPVVDETIKVSLVRPEGGITTRDIRVSSLKSLTLTAKDGFVKNRALLSSVRQLGSEDFAERERAFVDLQKLGADSRADLEMCLKFTTDIETQTRLKSILSKMPPAGPKSRGQMLFDLIHVDEPQWGHLGDTAINVLVDGKPHRLTRRDIAGLSAMTPSGGPAPTLSGPAGFRRLRIEEFPAGCSEEPFEKMPDGRPINIGDNIERTFLSRGFVLSTSIKSSWVSVNGFSVQGKSRGLSAANHQPLWEGEITVRFVVSGREEVPAGVTHFGCYIASVVPGGTAMVAFDLAGRELGRVVTQVNGHEFLGMTSSIPIHRVRFVPNPKLDRDYTLDDFIFTTPQSPEARHGEKFGVTLAAGDRIFCSDVELRDGNAHLIGMPGRLPNRTVRLSDVRRINLPDGNEPLGALPTGVFVELRDGSIMFGNQPPLKQGAPVFRLPVNPLKKQQDVVGLWGSKHSRVLRTPTLKQAVRWDAWERKWLDIAEVRLDDEEVRWKVGDTADAQMYHKLGPLWLADPPAAPVPGWHLSLRQGDDIVLTRGQPITGRLSQKLHAAWRDHNLQLGPKDVSSLFWVPAPASGKPAQRKPAQRESEQSRSADR